MEIGFTRRLRALPPYLFAEIDRIKSEARARGVDTIDLGIGDPDIPTPPEIVERLCRAVRDSANHRYPSYEGLLELRQAFARWYQDRYGVTLDPEREVLSLIGTKEGISHIFLAFVEPGDLVLLPDPGYPVYTAGTSFAGGISHYLPLTREDNYLIDIDAVPSELARRAKLMFINYPNNPTGATVHREGLQGIVDFALQNGIILCADAAYAELVYDGHPCPSLLQVEGGREVGLEFHSLSKTFSMAGWRIGFAVGNERLIQGLGTVKKNVDSGIFQAVQCAAIEALEHCRHYVAKHREVYRRRRDLLVGGLRNLGWGVDLPPATFYVWAPTLEGRTSMEMAKWLLNECGIIATPGVGFGEHGEGYIRMSLTIATERLEEALERIGEKI